MYQKILFWAAALLLFSSCGPPVQLFENPQPSAENRNVLRQYFSPKEPVIQAGDKITVSIWGHDDLSVGSVNSPYNANEVTGRWVVVDNDGEVNLPRIGRVRVAGYDMKEVNYILEARYREVLKDPIINVKVLNHYVTVLGEVNAPGKYAMDNEQPNLVQMIGQAEGLTPYAKAEQVKVIRQVSGRPVELRVDMTDLVLFSEYNVQLQPDDVVYIGPTKKKNADEKLRRGTTVAGILTGVALAASLILR